MCVWHPLIGPVVGSANLWKGSRTCTNGVGKERVQCGVYLSELRRHNGCGSWVPVCNTISFVPVAST